MILTKNINSDAEIFFSSRQVLQYVAKRNGRSMTLTLEQFEAVNRLGPKTEKTPLRSNVQVLKNAFTSFDMSHVKVYLLRSSS
jgi:hypothetical protein